MNTKWERLAEDLLDAASGRHFSEMLDYASRLYARHGCNDFEFPKDWTLQDRQDFVRLYHVWNGDPESYYPDKPVIQDFAAMAFLAAMMKPRR